MNPLLDTFSAQCRDYLIQGQGLLIACSGGPDSQCLLDLFGRLQATLNFGPLLAVGLDHGLRSNASAELDLAENLAQAHGIPFHRSTLKLRKSGNLMENARDARYTRLRELAQSKDIRVIATGHTATDQAETILFHLVRGAGSAGASGMGPLDGGLFRPLLGISREETIAHVNQEHIAFASDPTNEDSRYSRVHLRQSVLPSLSRINPKAIDNIGFFGTLAREDDNFLQDHATEVLSQNRGILGSLSLEKIHKIPTPILRRTLRAWCLHHQIDSNRATSVALFEAVRANAPWKRSAGRDTVLEIAANHLWCDRKFDGYTMPLRPEITASIPFLDCKLNSESHDLPQVTEFTKTLRKKKHTEVAFDADQLHLELQVRTWRENDRIQLFGAIGHSTLGDLFTNAKIPGPLRKRWPLVVAGSEGKEILWIPGIKRGTQAPLTEATRRCLTLKLSGKIWPTHR